MITIQFTGNTIEEVMLQIKKAAIGEATKQMAEEVKADLETESEAEVEKPKATRKKKEPEAPKKNLSMDKDVMPAFQKFLAEEGAKSGTDYAKQKIKAIVETFGATNVRSLPPEHYEAALAEIGA